MNPRLSAATTLLAIAAGSLALWFGTDGGTAWTAESARRLAIADNPVPLPAARLRDSRDRALTLTRFERPIVLMDFIYTRCPAACIEMGAAFRRLQRDLEALGLQKQVQLLSLTFDPGHDGPTELAEYLARFSADETHWTAAKFENPRAQEAVLERLGVVVIPQPGTRHEAFVHNAAVYLAHRGRVVGIYDFDDRDRLLEDIAWRLTPG